MATMNSSSGHTTGHTLSPAERSAIPSTPDRREPSKFGPVPAPAPVPLIPTSTTSSLVQEPHQEQSLSTTSQQICIEERLNRMNVDEFQVFLEACSNKSKIKHGTEHAAMFSQLEHPTKASPEEQTPSLTNAKYSSSLQSLNQQAQQQNTTTTTTSSGRGIKGQGPNPHGQNSSSKGGPGGAWTSPNPNPSYPTSHATHLTNNHHHPPHISGTHPSSSSNHSNYTSTSLSCSSGDQPPSSSSSSSSSSYSHHHNSSNSVTVSLTNSHAHPSGISSSNSWASPSSSGGRTPITPTSTQNNNTSPCFSSASSSSSMSSTSSSINVNYNFSLRRPAPKPQVQNHSEITATATLPTPYFFNIRNEENEAEHKVRGRSRDVDDKGVHFKRSELGDCVSYILDDNGTPSNLQLRGEYASVKCLTGSDFNNRIGPAGSSPAPSMSPRDGNYVDFDASVSSRSSTPTFAEASSVSASLNVTRRVAPPLEDRLEPRKRRNNKNKNKETIINPEEEPGFVGDKPIDQLVSYIHDEINSDGLTSNPQSKKNRKKARRREALCKSHSLDDENTELSPPIETRSVSSTLVEKKSEGAEAGPSDKPQAKGKKNQKKAEPPTADPKSSKTAEPGPAAEPEKVPVEPKKDPTPPEKVSEVSIKAGTKEKAKPAEITKAPPSKKTAESETKKGGSEKVAPDPKPSESVSATKPVEPPKATKPTEAAETKQVEPPKATKPESKGLPPSGAPKTPLSSVPPPLSSSTEFITVTNRKKKQGSKPAEGPSQGKTKYANQSSSADQSRSSTPNRESDRQSPAPVEKRVVEFKKIEKTGSPVPPVVKPSEVQGRPAPIRPTNPVPAPEPDRNLNLTFSSGKRGIPEQVAVNGQPSPVSTPSEYHRRQFRNSNIRQPGPAQFEQSGRGGGRGLNHNLVPAHRPSLGPNRGTPPRQYPNDGRGSKYVSGPTTSSRGYTSSYSQGRPRPLSSSSSFEEKKGPFTPLVEDKKALTPQSSTEEKKLVPAGQTPVTEEKKQPLAEDFPPLVPLVSTKPQIKSVVTEGSRPLIFSNLSGPKKALVDQPEEASVEQVKGVGTESETPLDAVVQKDGAEPVEFCGVNFDRQQPNNLLKPDFEFGFGVNEVLQDSAAAALVPAKTTTTQSVQHPITTPRSPTTATESQTSGPPPPIQHLAGPADGPGPKHKTPRTEDKHPKQAPQPTQVLGPHGDGPLPLVTPQVSQQAPQVLGPHGDGPPPLDFPQVSQQVPTTSNPPASKHSSPDRDREGLLGRHPQTVVTPPAPAHHSYHQIHQAAQLHMHQHHQQQQQQQHQQQQQQQQQQLLSGYPINQMTTSQYAPYFTPYPQMGYPYYTGQQGQPTPPPHMAMAPTPPPTPLTHPIHHMGIHNPQQQIIIPQHPSTYNYQQGNYTQVAALLSPNIVASQPQPTLIYAQQTQPQQAHYQKSLASQTMYQQYQLPTLGQQYSPLYQQQQQQQQQQYLPLAPNVMIPPPQLHYTQSLGSPIPTPMISVVQTQQPQPVPMYTPIPVPQHGGRQAVLQPPPSPHHAHQAYSYPPLQVMAAQGMGLHTSMGYLLSNGTTMVYNPPEVPSDLNVNSGPTGPERDSGRGGGRGGRRGRGGPTHYMGREGPRLVNPSQRRGEPNAGLPGLMERPQHYPSQANYAVQPQPEIAYRRNSKNSPSPVTSPPMTAQQRYGAGDYYQQQDRKPRGSHESHHPHSERRGSESHPAAERRVSESHPAAERRGSENHPAAERRGSEHRQGHERRGSESRNTPVERRGSESHSTPVERRGSESRNTPAERRESESRPEPERLEPEEDPKVEGGESESGPTPERLEQAACNPISEPGPPQTEDLFIDRENELVIDAEHPVESYFQPTKPSAEDEAEEEKCENYMNNYEDKLQEAIARGATVHRL